MGAGTRAGGASASWGGGPRASRSGESQSPGMATAARSAPVRVAAACSPLLLPPPLGRGLACGARAGGVWWGAGGVGVCGPGSWEGFCLFGSPCGCCGAAGPRTVGGGGSGRLEVGGRERESSACRIGWMCLKRKPGKGLHVDRGNLG